MRSLIVTVAGSATRFNRDTEEQTLKCLYHIGSPKKCLLYQIFDKARDVDEFIVVGGFLYDKLTDFIKTDCAEFAAKITTVYNPLFAEYGSGYSLVKGVESLSGNSDEVVFVEGDLFFDKAEFARILNSEKDVITVNHELIDARKAVILYETEEGRFKYLYDTSHKTLIINEPFLAIYNSGQICIFKSVDGLKIAVTNLTAKQIQGTNLEIIQSYFGNMNRSDVEIVPMTVWYNCNTVADYKKVYSIIENENVE